MNDILAGIFESIPELAEPVAVPQPSLVDELWADQVKEPGYGRGFWYRSDRIQRLADGQWAWQYRAARLPDGWTMSTPPCEYSGEWCEDPDAVQELVDRLNQDMIDREWEQMKAREAGT